MLNQLKPSSSGKVCPSRENVKRQRCCIENPSNSLEMKCLSAIRTVCLVLSVQIVALSDAKSIGPSLSPAAAYTVADASPVQTLTNTTNDSSAEAEIEWNGENDPPPPFLSGQEQHHHRRRRVLLSTGRSSRVLGTSSSRYTAKYTIDHLLEHVYDFKISNDIDLDPCKTGN